MARKCVSLNGGDLVIRSGHFFVLRKVVRYHTKISLYIHFIVLNDITPTPEIVFHTNLDSYTYLFSIYSSVTRQSLSFKWSDRVCRYDSQVT